MKKILFILLLLAVSASAQMRIPDHASRFISASRDAGVTLRNKDYNALIRFSEKVFLTGVTTGYDSTGSVKVYSYTESGHTMTALYPVIGNTLASQAFNLVVAGTSTASPTYYGTFVGSPTAGDGQVPWNGTTQYFRSNIPLTTFSAFTTMSMSYYSYTANAAAAMIDMGAFNGSYPILSIFLRWTDNKTYGMVKETGLAANVTCITSQGFRLINRTKSDSSQIYNNAELLGTKFATRNNGAFQATPLFIGASCNACVTAGATPNFFSNRTWAGSHIGTGLTNTQAFSLALAFIDLKYNK